MVEQPSESLRAAAAAAAGGAGGPAGRTGRGHLFGSRWIIATAFVTV